MENTKNKQLVITREFNHPRTIVWNAFTESHHLAHWWGPAGSNIEIKKFELRNGGVFHYGLTAPDGNKMWGKFTYEDIKAPEKITFISSFADESGSTIAPPFPGNFPKEIYNTWIFTEQNGKTTIKLTGHPINATSEEQAFYESMFESMNQGFGGTFNQLEAYLAK